MSHAPAYAPQTTDLPVQDDHGMKVRRPAGYRMGWALSATVALSCDPLRTRVVRYWDGAVTWAPLYDLTKVFLTKQGATDRLRDGVRHETVCVTHTGEHRHDDPTFILADLRPRKVFVRVPPLHVLRATHGADWEDLGCRLAYAREGLGLTQLQAGEAAGVGRSAISEIETGTRKINALELRLFADLYGRTSLSALMTGLGGKRA